ncbi:MAG: hypothetical protein K2I10_06220 [Lachnospiraceae bacterium]|nr:hypothetical protein [Lachnospiraceae bacterium]
MTRLLSNLIKSGFIAFSQNDKLVIDANRNEIIRGIDANMKEAAASEEKADSMEESLAEALIRDVGLDDGEDIDFTMDTEELSGLLAEPSEQLRKVADKILLSAKQEAEEIVSKAHYEAEQLRATAYEELESLKAATKEEGYQAGYEEGQTAVKSKFDAMMKELEQKEQEFELYMTKRKEELVKTTEVKMVELLCQLIPSITGVVIENQKDVLFYIINTAMQDLENSKHFVVRVSPKDYENLFEKKEDIYGALNPNIEIEIFEDSKLSDLQCIIETDNGIVDVSLDVQLDNLKKALKLMIQE